jgi:hypothetical protein
LSIEGFEFDDNNIREIERHLDHVRVSQVLENEFITVRNRKGRSATRLLVGRDNGGAYITVPISPTSDPRIWRPITAWLSKPHERGWLEGAKLGRE